MATAPPETAQQRFPPKAPKRASDRTRVVVASAWVLGIALMLAWLIHAIQNPLQQQPEKAVMMTAILLVAILIGVPAAYVLRMGRRARPATAGLLFLSACSVL